MSQKSDDFCDLTPLSFEDFLSLFQRAYDHSDSAMLSDLRRKYPDFYSRAYLQTVPIAPDFDDKSSPYPILSQKSNTTPCVMNMITYLTGLQPTDQHLALLGQVKCLQRRNARTDEIFCIYDEQALWRDFFLKDETLSSIIVNRKINSLQELIFHTKEFFENAPLDYFPPNNIL